MNKQPALQVTKSIRPASIICFLFVLMMGTTSCANKPYNPRSYESALANEPRSTDYEVWINGTKAIVYVARVQDPPWEKEKTKLDFGGNYSFTTFDMDKPVKVKIKSTNKPLDKTVLLPEGIGVTKVKKSASEISFVIEKPAQIVVEPDGKNGPLMLFSNSVEDYKPDLNDPDLIYFGPGIHHPDSALVVVKDNQTLYLAEGAVVKAGVSVIGNNVTIRGRGIICGNEFVWGQRSRNSIVVNRSDNVVVKDVILRGAATWTMPIRNSSNVTVDNVKIVAGRAQNDDGINPCNSQDVLITNCFIRTDDDCLALKGLTNDNANVERIRVENCILWCDRARVFLLGHESRAEYMRDLVFKNIDILHFKMTAFLLEPGENMRLENAVFENIKIYGEGQQELIRLQPVVNQYMRTKVPGNINNITFKDITVTGKEGLYKVQLLGESEEYSVKKINLFGITVPGQNVTKDYPNLETNDFASNISFKANLIKVTAPDYCSDIKGNTKIEVEAPNYSTLNVHCWKHGKGYGKNTLVGTITLDKNGKGSIVFPADAYPHGPTTVTISGVNKDDFSDNCYLQLYNNGGVSWNEGLPPDPPAAKGMQLVFADDFNAELSIGLESDKFTYYDHKPPFGSQDFSSIRFTSFDRPNNPFSRKDTYLRIRADANKKSAGLISSLFNDGRGVKASAPCYFECRFIGPNAPGSWPAFWLLSVKDKTDDNREPCDEIDIIEAYGGEGKGHPNAKQTYRITPHAWGQSDELKQLCDNFYRTKSAVDVYQYGIPSTWYETSHIYGCKITETETVYYCDDIEVGRHETLPISKTKPFYFMINLATGGGWPVDLSRYNGMVDMYVDYVRVYSGAVAK